MASAVSWPTAVVIVVAIAAGTVLAVTGTTVPAWLGGIFLAVGAAVGGLFPRLFGGGETK